MLKVLIGLLCIYSVTSFGANITVSVDSAVAVGNKSVGIGSSVSINSEDDQIRGPAIFLGSAVRPDGSSSYQIYLNQKSGTVFYIDSSNFNRSSKLQKVLDPYEQAGGTCAAYAIDQFMIQTHLSGFTGTGALADVLSTEEGRTHLLADSINQYYLTLNHRFSTPGILNGFGKKFGFKCQYLKGSTYETIKEKILSHLQLGSPVIVSFSTGPNMVKSPFKLKMYDQSNVKLDERLWIPRKIGERESGGHSIVAVASFEFNNKTFLIMLDSDWSEPRVWNMDSYINQKTDLSEIDFVNCK
ncbi:MAG: hypothetical protein WC635_10420 [Bacteriovorax sp.]|jgi:hypothetical protein